MTAGLDLALFLVLMFFSGIWSAIKLVDEHTDNKLVFFIPAAVLSLFLLTGIGEGFVFYACLFAFGPIIVMLVKVGLEQGKEGFSTSGLLPSPSSYGQGSVPLDLNRKLAPSYIRAYDRLIGYIQARGGAIKSREDGRQRLSEIWGVPESNVGRFFDSPYVIKTLGLEESKTPVEGGIIGDDWWEKGYDSDDQSGSKSETVQKIESKISSAPESTGDSCGHPGCSADVTAFDFRCYTCRNRFCSEHAGSSIDCDGCAN